jgi:hypothetical protein
LRIFPVSMIFSTHLQWQKFRWTSQEGAVLFHYQERASVRRQGIALFHKFPLLFLFSLFVYMSLSPLLYEDL